MRIFCLALILYFSQVSFAGIGGSGGGATPKPKGKYVTVEVCNSYENGNVCQMVTFKEQIQEIRSTTTECKVMYGELEVPCPETYGVPNWVRRLNDWFRQFEE